MHLKADGIFIDHDKPQWLMYVQFSYGTRKVRWYPKWCDVLQLVTDSLGTERLNKGRLQDFFVVSLMGVLHEHLLRRETTHHARSLPRRIGITITNVMNAINDTIRSVHGYPRSSTNDDYTTDVPACLLEQGREE